MPDLNQEIWTDEVVEQFRETEDASFLEKIPSYDDKVQTSKNGMNQNIHLTDIGADPEVLINNTTYPIPSAPQVDGDISITLDKLDSKNTTITDDELEYIAYDKIRKVTEKHVKSIDRTKYAKAVHALAPAANATATPVIPTSGDDNGLGVKKFSKKDILALKKRFDAQKIPMEDRILVLYSDHYNDMLDSDEKFAQQILDPRTGKLLPYMGFEIYQYVECPYFHDTTGAKLAYGAVPTANHNPASVAFYAPDMFRATGKTKLYMGKSRDDPKYRENEIGMRHYYIGLPKKQRAIGAVYSAVV